MREQVSLADLPEAVPLRRVSPVWRWLTLLACIGMILLVALAGVLGMALLKLHYETMSTYAPPIMAAPPDDDDETASGRLPYPLRADLQRDGFPEEEKSDTPSARSRFLRLGKEVWKPPVRQAMSELAVSPDGQQLAYVSHGELYVGSFDELRLATLAFAAPVSRFAGGSLGPNIGIPRWSHDSQMVYLGDGGLLWRYHRNGGGQENFRFRGQWPAPGRNDQNEVFFVRNLPAPRLETPGQPVTPDLSEVVLASIWGGREQILVPKGRSSWSHLTTTADGKRLALVSDRGLEGRSPALRVFVLDVPAEGQAVGELKAITPPARQVGPVCWRPDRKGLIYARSQHPVPADHSEDEPAAFADCDLFEYDLGTGQESRLTRGGGFFSPSVCADDTLFFAVSVRDGTGPGVRLRKLALASAREFAASEPEPAPRDAAAWDQFFDHVLAECEVPADADGARLTAERLGKLFDVYQRRYEEQFRVKPPTDGRGLSRLQRELSALDLTAASRQRTTLVLGAVQGEYLRRRLGAVWQLSNEPLLPDPSREPARETPFGCVVNPFRLAAPAADALTLGAVLKEACGRPLILANDPKAGQEAVAQRTDPRLARAAELFRVKKAEEADELLQELLQDPKHRGNVYLCLEVGKLLYEQQRRLALKQIMQEQCRAQPDARAYNLLGLALLEPDPRAAATAFYDALRCDLHYGPAYLNLALALEQTGNSEGARQTLRRYLRLLPNAPLADDVRRRLAELEGR